MNIISNLFFNFKYFSVYVRDTTILVLILFLVTKKKIFEKVLEYLFFSNILTFTYSFMFIIGELLNFKYFNKGGSITKENLIKLFSKLIMLIILIFLKVKSNIKGFILFLISLSIYAIIYNINNIYKCSLFEFLVLILVSCLIQFMINYFLLAK